MAINKKNRYWFVTVQLENMRKAGLTQEQINKPEVVANYFLNLWTSSSKTRTGCMTVCVSQDGLYHLHGALSGESTTLSAVAKLLFDAHVEVCKGGKSNMMKYVLKEPPFDEQGEQVLYKVGEENLQKHQGKRTDIQEIERMLENGYTPSEIFSEGFRYRKYESMIKSAYADKRTKDAPRTKKMNREWHVGESGSGKTYTYEKLCDAYGEDQIYFAGYMQSGWIDSYMEVGAPPILFLDELKAVSKWSELLNILDIYTKRLIHARYKDISPLWTQVYITSIFPPEEIYRQLVSNDKRENDSLKQLLRRLDYIVYHYIDNGIYKEFKLPASEYVNYEDLKRRAFENQSIIKENETQEVVANHDAKVTIKLVNVQEVHNDEEN